MIIFDRNLHNSFKLVKQVKITDKIEFRKTLDTFENSLNKIIKSFEEDGEALVYLLNRKHQKQNYTISEKFFKLTGRISSPYQRYNNRLKFEKQINESKFNIEKKHIELIENHIKYKQYIKKYNIYVSQSNIVNKITKENEKLLEDLLHIISVDLNSEVNDFILSKNKFIDISKKIIENISISLHIIYDNNYFNRNVQYSKLIEINERQLKTGDIILFDEYKNYKESIIRKHIAYFTGSTVMHSAIVYKKDVHNNHLIFEADGTNRRKTYINKFKPEEGIKYIILRHRKKIINYEKNKILKIIESKINKNFSVTKMYGAGINYKISKFYNKYIPKYVNKLTFEKNFLPNKGIFCSEIISSIYKEMNRNITSHRDLGMVSPIDIFNSFELDIVGYISDEKFKNNNKK